LKHPRQQLGRGHFIKTKMKRRNFIKTLVAAAVATALPASATRDILIHKGNPNTLTLPLGGFPIGTVFELQNYQKEALTIIAQGGHIQMNVARGLGKTAHY